MNIQELYFVFEYFCLYKIPFRGKKKSSDSTNGVRKEDRCNSVRIQNCNVLTKGFVWKKNSKKTSWMSKYF